MNAIIFMNYMCFYLKRKKTNLLRCTYVASIIVVDSMVIAYIKGNPESNLIMLSHIRAWCWSYSSRSWTVLLITHIFFFCSKFDVADHFHSRSKQIKSIDPGAERKIEISIRRSYVTNPNTCKQKSNIPYWRIR